jgi:hypothetical protein
MIGDGVKKSVSSRRARSCSNSVSVMSPLAIISIRSCSKFARQSLAPGDPPCHMKVRASAPTSTSPCARSRLNSVRPKRGSALRLLNKRIMAACVFRGTSPGLTDGSANMEVESNSSSTSQPPGLSAEIMRRRAISRSGKCKSTRRLCTRSKASSASPSLTMLAYECYTSRCVEGQETSAGHRGVHVVLAELHRQVGWARRDSVDLVQRQSTNFSTRLSGLHRCTDVAVPAALSSTPSRK